MTLSGTLSVFALLLALMLLPTVAVLFVECLASLLRVRTNEQTAQTASRIAVIVPAHNEAEHLQSTLEQIQLELSPDDRLIVVADNCTDATAQIAAGAQVIQRNDTTRVGKGYALDAGVRHLEPDPPDVVVFMDADCRTAPGAIRKLVGQVISTARPAQGAYWMMPGAKPRVNDLISALAVTVKNVARPRGLRHLGLPCLLTGTGMAFPWQIIRNANLASPSIVEDMQLALDLALARQGALFCPDAHFEARLPTQRAAAIQQRRRWEHGHLHTVFTKAFPLLARGIVTANFQAIAIAMDVAVLPLALLTLLLIFDTALASAVFYASANPHWLILPSIELTLLTLAVLVVWGKFASRQIPFISLAAAPLYLAWKVPIYTRFLFNRQKKWVRTERDAVPIFPVEPISDLDPAKS